ncbi:MAG: DNA recombination protein RmuC, partial [candidate division WOR-3 bacterium]|nr:DNA recombination protein RmuC [candidate division WOR-3 bacterium]
SNTRKTIEMIEGLKGIITKLTSEQEHATKLTEELKYLFQKPKARGNYTEVILEEMLGRILPRGIWDKECNIKPETRERVDFIIRYNKRIIPIDVKFPIDDYKRYVNEEEEEKRERLWAEFIRTVKGLIKDISSKYISPENNTSEFAIMFIPSDSIYFEIISNDTSRNLGVDIFDYGREYQVMLAGPSTFYAFLQIIITGLKNVRIYENSKILIENLKKLEKKLEHFNSKYEDTGKYLEKAIESYNVSQTHYSHIKSNAENLIDMESEMEKEE